jgi:hypothetical protein
MSERIREETSYEPSDANARLVVAIAATVAVVVIVSIAILAISYPSALSPSSLSPSRLPPKPRLLVNEPADLARFEAAQKKRLDSYGWVDRRRGIVHIPIKEAMKRVAAKGFSDWPGNPQ